MFEVWNSVQVTNAEHPRHNEAGTVFAVDRAHPEEVAVRFDTDSQVQLVPSADLKLL
jgi:hypothetical protein